MGDKCPIMPGMWSIPSLIAVADAYKEALGLPEKTVSKRCMNDSSRLAELREGSCDIGTRRLRRVLLWFAENWPEGAVWPPLVERPARQPEDDVEPKARRRGEHDDRVAA